MVGIKTILECFARNLIEVEPTGGNERGTAKCKIGWCEYKSNCLELSGFMQRQLDRELVRSEEKQLAE